MNEMHNKNEGFTLVELIIVVAIMGVLQKRDDWQAFDPVVIAGKTHYKSEGNTANWKGIPVANGECEVSYNEATGILFDWKGTGKDSSGTTIDFNEDLHGILDRTGILNDLIKQSVNRFEIDSKCLGSNMVNKQIEEQDNSLLKYGTWAYLGSPSNSSGRYLFWTSVDTNTVGSGKKIPVIVSKANGGFYISETTTAYRNPTNKENYVAIADHIHNDYGFQQYTKGDQYDTLKEAYEAYSKLLKDGKYSEYKNTLPK